MKKPERSPRVTIPFLLPKLILLFLLSGFGMLQVAYAQTHALTNLWSLPADPASFMNPTNHLTRGMAYNPVTGHLLVASRTPTATQTNAIYILDSTTGATLGTLPYDPVVITNGTFTINLVGVTPDGVIYVCNLTTDATNPVTPFKLYRWANESAMPTVAFTGDPSLLNLDGASPRRFGDSMAIRGTGANTQILLGTLNQTMALLTTADGLTFTSKRITTDGEISDTRWGLAWGKGDTFWAKQTGKNLKLYSLNIAAGTATVTVSSPLYTIPGGTTLTPGGALAYDPDRELISVLDASNHKVWLYDVSDPAHPIQTDMPKNMPAANANGNFVGAAHMRNGLLFVLETNNGIQAYSVHGGIVFPPQVVIHPSNAPQLWEGARHVFSGSVYGTPPFTYQWQFNGVDLPGETASTLVLPGVSIDDVGSYRFVVANSAGEATSNPGQVSTPVAGNRTAQVTNLWSILPFERPYLTTADREYGIAINPVNNNVLVLTRQAPTTNMLVVLDHLTGAEKHYIDYSPLKPLSTSGWNKVDVADDGTVYLCNMTANVTTEPFRIDALAHDGPNADIGRALFDGDPGAGQTPPDIVWGGTMAVRGNWNTAQILLGSGAWNKSSKTVSILQADANGLFTATPITISDAPDKFARLGLDWGPGENTFWAKSVGELVLVEFDLAAGTGFVKKIYPTTGNRSMANSVTGIRYHKGYDLLAGIQNGAPPSPVSVPIFNISDIEAGPLWVDQELYTTYNNEVHFQGNVDFANEFLVALGGNNGIMAFQINPGFVPTPVIVTHPVGGAWFEQVDSPTLKVVADAASPMTYQWYKGTETLVGEVNSTFTLQNLQMSDAGDYWVRVSTTGGSVDSRAATLEVMPYVNTPQMTTMWSVEPLTRPYLNTFYFEYGMAFNPANSNLLVASYINTNNVMVIGVMDALTGEHKHVMDLTTVTNGGNRWINRVGVADDGVVYVANRVTSTATPFVVYRWANDAPSTVASEAFKGDPFPVLFPAATKNIGFTMDLRGGGASTEILLSTATTNVLSILTTTDGLTFTAHEILVPGAANAFARLGVCFGEGNTIWTKAWGGNGGLMHLIEYDLEAGLGTIVRTYTDLPYEMTSIAYNSDLKFLGALSRDNHKNMQLYSVADLDHGPILLDQEIFPTLYSSIEANNAIDFGGNHYLFGLDSNNGVIGMQINAAYAPSVVLKASVEGGQLVLTWFAVEGASYQVQQKGTLDGAWQNLGSPVVATGTTGTYSETLGAGPRFYRVQSLNP